MFVAKIDKSCLQIRRFVTGKVLLIVGAMGQLINQLYWKVDVSDKTNNSQLIVHVLTTYNKAFSNTVTSICWRLLLCYVIQRSQHVQDKLPTTTTKRNFICTRNKQVVGGITKCSLIDTADKEKRIELPSEKLNSLSVLGLRWSSLMYKNSFSVINAAGPNYSGYISRLK